MDQSNVLNFETIFSTFLILLFKEFVNPTLFFSEKSVKCNNRRGRIKNLISRDKSRNSKYNKKKKLVFHSILINDEIMPMRHAYKKDI